MMNTKPKSKSLPKNKNMVNAQEYINKNYPQEIRKNLKSLEISGKDLEGHLDLKDFINLESLDCYENRIISLDLTNNKNLIYLNSSSNSISELDLSKTSIKEEDYGKNLRTDLLKEKIIFQDVQQRISQGIEQPKKKKVFLGGT